MNSLLYYYNNVQKMAAYRQAKRMQRGVKLGYGETGVYSSTTPAKLLLSNPISIGTSDFTIEYYGNAYGSGSVSSPLLFNRSSLGASARSSYFQAYGLRLGENNLNWVTFGIPEGGNITTDSLNFNYSAPTLDAKFHLVITRQGKNVSVYIDNVLVASKEQTEIKDMGEFVLGIANSSDVSFVRVWNYALSADEIATLYNNNDPMGYVVPKAKRDGLIAEYLPQNLMEYPNAGDLDVLSPNSYTWTGPDDSNYGISIPLSGYITAKKCVVTIEVSNYEAGAPFFKISTSNSTSIPQQNGTFELEQIILGDAYNRVAIYGGNEGTDRRMTITVKGIRQINGISYSWLDSAKQMPLSDEYMEPLFQSIGGYDMAANGAPEILYNE